MSYKRVPMKFPNYFADAESSFKDADFIIFGVPYDKTSTFRKGAAKAPKEIRQVSWNYETYDILYHQEDLAVELEKPGITLFRNEHPTARVYGVDSVVYIDSLDEYLALSKKQDVMEHLYIIGSGLSDNNNVFPLFALP